MRTGCLALARVLAARPLERESLANVGTRFATSCDAVWQSEAPWFRGVTPVQLNRGNSKAIADIARVRKCFNVLSVLVVDLHLRTFRVKQVDLSSLIDRYTRPAVARVCFLNQ